MRLLTVATFCKIGPGFLACHFFGFFRLRKLKKVKCETANGRRE
jgi:hypothetical protein